MTSARSRLTWFAVLQLCAHMQRLVRPLLLVQAQPTKDCRDTKVTGRVYILYDLLLRRCGCRKAAT